MSESKIGGSTEKDVEIHLWNLAKEFLPSGQTTQEARLQSLIENFHKLWESRRNKI